MPSARGNSFDPKPPVPINHWKAVEHLALELFLSKGRFGCGSKPFWCHFGVVAPHILDYCSGDWDVHQGYGILTLPICFWMGMYFLGTPETLDSWLIPASVRSTPGNRCCRPEDGSLHYGHSPSHMGRRKCGSLWAPFKRHQKRVQSKRHTGSKFKSWGKPQVLVVSKGQNMGTTYL